jgi:hypothetical protein
MDGLDNFKINIINFMFVFSGNYFLSYVVSSSFHTRVNNELSE